MNFNNITFIVLVKDNLYQSVKLIDYVNKLPFKLKLIIADGSKDKQEKIFKNIKTKNKSYFYSGYDKNILSMYKKINKSLKKVQTSFVYFLDQGDYLNFVTLKKCENKLRKDKSISIAIGNIYNFTDDKNNFTIRSKLYKRKPIINKKLLPRLTSNFHLRSYHGLHRTKVLENSIKIILKHNLNDSRSSEFVMDTNNLVYGNFSLINDILLLHESPKIKKIHTINKKFSSREKWFKDYFSYIIKGILKDILSYNYINSNKILLNKLVEYFFINDIQYNIKKKKLSVLSRIIDKTKILFKKDIKLNKFIKTIQNDTKIKNSY